MSQRIEELLLASTDKINEAYQLAIRNGRKKPVIAIFDLGDEVAYRTLEALAGKEKIARPSAMVSLSGDIPVGSWDFEHDEALWFVDQFTTDGGEIIESHARQGLLPVIVLGDGGQLQVTATDRPK